MLPFTFYLLKVSICFGILFGYYWLLLRNKILHSYNRFYLLASVILSITLPLIQINVWQNAGSETPEAIKLLQVVNGKGDFISDDKVNARAGFSYESLLGLFYAATCFIFLCLFISVLVKIYQLLKTNSCKVLGNIYF